MVETSKYKQDSCELKRNRREKLDIDIIPYLKNGHNSIEVEAVIGGYGESWVQIRTKQHSFQEVESWEELCKE